MTMSIVPDQDEGSSSSASDAAFQTKRGRRSRRAPVTQKRGSLNSSSGQGAKMAGGRVASMHLPAEQQMELAKCVRAWEEAKAAKQAEEDRVGRSLTFGEWAALLGLAEGALRRRVEDGRKARELLITTNLNLVKSMALRFCAQQERNENRLSMDDLVLEGTQGLLKSCSKFDPAVGVRFTTYAVWWIRQAMSLAIQTHSNTVRLPILLQARIKKVREARARLYLQLEREPSAEELAEAVGLPADKVEKIRRTGRGRSFLSEEDHHVTGLAVGLHQLPDTDAEPLLHLATVAGVPPPAVLAAPPAAATAEALLAETPAATVATAALAAEERGAGRARSGAAASAASSSAKEELLGQLKRSDREVVETRWELQRRERTVLAVSGRKMRRIQDELTAFLRSKDVEDRMDVFDSMLFCTA